VELARKAVSSWLNEPNVKITLVECAFGDRDHQLADLASDRVTHVPVYAKTLLWNKENLLNLGIQRLPRDAKYVLTADADVTWRQPGWATDIINSLDLYPVVQPWATAYDLGPKDEHLTAHKSFSSLSHAGKPVIPKFDKETLSLTNSPYQYPHPGYAWAWVIDFLEFIGGLFEWGGVGSGDHHMALSMVGSSRMSIPGNVNGNYRKMLSGWESLSTKYAGGRIGYTNHTIEHMFHGRKENRAYNSRWKMFLDHDFDPVSDTKRNRYGVLEFSGNKPILEKEWDNYLRARNEDQNSL
jgi:hypothetical protein